MKIAVNTIRVLVGLLFIFSGLVKANDPLGLSYKMEEFFELWGMTKFNSWTLLLSVLMNAFEIIAGFALLLGWRIKLFSWLLLLLILFFTFLTGYTYVKGVPKNCGCFGDCLLITSKTSFLKDVVLTVLIVFLFWKQKMIQPLLKEKWNTAGMLGITIFSFGFQWYTLTYLPVVDCLPFKTGNNISRQMQRPANAIPDSMVIMFEYEKNGQHLTFNANNFPADFDSTYTYVKRFEKKVREGKNNVPKITGFKLAGSSGEDSTAVILSQPVSVLVFINDISSFGEWKNSLVKVYEAAKNKNVPLYLVCRSAADANEKMKNTPLHDVPVFASCDGTTIRMAARTNPTIYLLNTGTVKGKWSSKRTGSAISAIEKQQ